MNNILLSNLIKIRWIAIIGQFTAILFVYYVLEINILVAVSLCLVLVSILVIVAILSLPIVVTSGNVHFKHALEWNYFVGVISFYLLSRFFWMRTT